MFPREHGMDENSTLVSRRASEVTKAFGLLIRSRRKALNLTQDQLALATGVGRRFLIDLEAGKTTCQLGRSLLVAETLGMRGANVLNATGISPSPDILELPAALEEEPEDVGAAVG